MLRISKLTDYAMLIMSHLATMSGEIMSASALAEVLHLNGPTVSKILKLLSDASLVESVRGAEGGYHLARAANEISVADIITAMEGALALTECCDTISDCAINSTCALRDNWKKINKMVYTLLSQLTLTDMLSPLSFKKMLSVTAHE